MFSITAPLSAVPTIPGGRFRECLRELEFVCSLLRLPAPLIAAHPGNTQRVQYDRIPNRQPVGVQNDLVGILDEGIECNAPAFVLENLAAMIAGGFNRVLIAVMPYRTAVDHNHLRSCYGTAVDFPPLWPASRYQSGPQM